MKFSENERQETVIYAGKQPKNTFVAALAQGKLIAMSGNRTFWHAMRIRLTAAADGILLSRGDWC
jgi:hypothetical protein